MAGPTTLDCQSSSNFEVNLNQLENIVTIADDCPTPTMDQFLAVCNSIYDRKPSEGDTLSFKYQEDMWNMSCAKPESDSKAVAKIKIQNMWNKNKESFRCYHFSSSTVPDGNITKFSMDFGFPGFLIEAVRTYQLDMNFKDPSDGKTILDFLKEQSSRIIASSPSQTAKIDEYERVYKLLQSNGAKHSKDL